MLISHAHRFIYLKTLKTGGTSVEIYFEPYCVDPDREFVERHHRESEVSKWGIIGARGQPPNSARLWYNHMPASRVLELIGPELWSQYYKFCVVRDPFDKTVSSFWHHLSPAERLELQRADFERARGRFHEWVRTARHIMDRDAFSIQGTPVVDRFVRYEGLYAGLRAVCQDLGLPWEPSRLGRYKSGMRLRNEPLAQYYDEDTADRVRQLYRWEIEFFHYCAP
jgi:hypothetical protein